MKPLAALLSLALLALPAMAEETPLQATVQKVWTVDTAREEVFQDAHGNLSRLSQVTARRRC